MSAGVAVGRLWLSLSSLGGFRTMTRRTTISLAVVGGLLAVGLLTYRSTLDHQSCVGCRGFRFVLKRSVFGVQVWHTERMRAYALRFRSSCARPRSRLVAILAAHEHRYRNYVRLQFAPFCRPEGLLSMTTPPNKPDAANPAIASGFQCERLWRGVADPGRSAAHARRHEFQSYSFTSLRVRGRG